MPEVEELQELTRDMDTVSLLRFLITEKFPKKIVVSCSLRARSVVVLKMISEIDPSTPIANKPTIRVMFKIKINP